MSALKLTITFTAMLLAMFGLDLVWLNNIAKPLYQAGIGHLMAESPKLGFAGLFYLIYISGLIFYGVQPKIAGKSVLSSFKSGALFGFFVYASYDLTNLALLKDWPLKLSIIDLTWGVMLSGTISAFGRFIYNKIKHKIIKN